MKILLADPHAEVRSALRLILERIPLVETVRAVSRLAQLQAQSALERPDLILLDLDLIRPTCPPSLAGLITTLRGFCPGSSIVVMSSRFDAEQEALAAGASGFISKTDPPDVVLANIAQFLKPDVQDELFSKGER